MFVRKFRAMNYITVFVVVYITIFQIVKAEDNVKLTRSDENSDENLENTEGMIRLSPPTLDEEEQNSPHMPQALRCDGCRVVAYQLSSEFNRRQKNLVKKKKLSESDVIEIVEKVCSNGFENYGLKGVDGVNRLSGPGLETEKSPGMMQGGGRWPVRLQNICNAYVGELEEEGIYEGFLENKTLEDYLCRREGLFGYCKDTPPPKKVEL